MGRFDVVQYENPETITVYCSMLLVYLSFNHTIDFVELPNNSERLKKDLYYVFILLKNQTPNYRGSDFHS